MKTAQFRPRSVCDFLDQAFPYLKDNIVSEEELSLLDFLRHDSLDLFEVSSLLFECPLKEDRKWVDLSMRIDPSSASFAHSIQNMKQAFPIADSWERCFCFLAKTKLKANYFIELDTGSRKEHPLLPNLFICTKSLQGKEFVLFAAELMRELDGKPPSPDCLANLHRYVEMCSSMGDQIFAFGMMLARPGNGLRIHSGFNLSRDPAQLKQRLEKVGYPSSPIELFDLLSKLPPSALMRIGFALDIGEKIGPKIGIERFDEKRKHSKDAWAPLLAFLVQERLATQERVEACLQWSGGLFQPNILHHDSLFFRQINHVKLVFQPGKELEAKIYLNTMHGQISPQNGDDFPFEYEPSV